ncbi:MAG: hypothetical protein JST89_00290 [Cyanobacteria bacterium SZAS-4]|nr:hypothetical protein [Cyanobacteria bacterium SZAS-4]
MKVLFAFSFVALIACMPPRALADVESHDDAIDCDFTIIGWTKDSLIKRKLEKNNFVCR